MQQGVHVAVGCSIKTSADYTVWGGLVERSLAVKRVKRLRPHDDCSKNTALRPSQPVTLSMKL